MSLTTPIKNQFKSVLNVYHQSLWNPQLSGELDFIDRTVSAFKNLGISAGGQILETRSKRIHLTPKVRFIIARLPSPKAVTKELADLLLVYKYFDNRVLQAYRAVLVQSKYTPRKSKSWRIDSEQFHLMTRWPKFRIVSPAKFAKSFLIKPQALTWSTYGFVGTKAVRYPIYYSSKRILRMKRLIPSSSSFSFNLQTPIGWDSSTSFLMKFVQGFVGENLQGNSSVKDLVDALYVIAKIKPDPPDELEWKRDNEERGGFGVVEFVVSTEEE